MQVYIEARGRHWGLLYHSLPYHLDTGLTKLCWLPAVYQAPLAYLPQS